MQIACYIITLLKSSHSFFYPSYKKYIICSQVISCILHFCFLCYYHSALLVYAKYGSAALIMSLPLQILIEATSCFPIKIQFFVFVFCLPMLFPLLRTFISSVLLSLLPYLPLTLQLYFLQAMFLIQVSP